jgi:putative Mg2+ transporter-C (MgtC) family protein
MAVGVEQAAVLEQLNVMVIVLWAMALGGIVGWERQLVAKPAGLRTHMLVAGSAALLTGITVDLALLSATGDPTRGIHAIITGIGFLGAGAILQQRNLNPSGLTTAATIMYTAVIGAAVAGGFGLAATAATLLAIFVLRVFSWGRPHGEDHHEPVEFT